MNKRLFFIAAIAAFMLTAVYCGSRKVYVQPHPQAGIKLHYDYAQFAGKNYQSLGLIRVETSKGGWASLFWGWDSVQLIGGRVKVSSPEVGDEMRDFLQEEMVARAQELGATAVVNLRYGHYEIGAAIPILGPWTRRYFWATGEAVR